MGIQGLLPLLKPIHNHTHVSEFSGKTLAVDAYVWLHKGAYGCAPDLVTGKPTVKYVDYAMHRVRMLRHFGIQPYLVFDGGPLPAKKGTEQERQKRRDENFARASELAKAGKHSQARDYYVKCVDVTPQMAYQLIKALRVEAVPYVVAPYEADAQLTYLERSGIVDGIITEDSDLLVFGARTVLFKFDISGSVVTISRAHFGNIHSGTFSLVGWTDTEFREMAMLSGCDYLASIPGIGLITAWKLLRKYKTVEKVLQFIRLEGAKKIPSSYLDSFRMAELAFKHQRVYCPRSRCLVYLTDIPDGHEWDSTKEAYIGL
ncbi:PIN domain-like protein [Sistotremastrum niveocremeum HHB9708]|uniref:PIN domain-like protein n=1 Tax=Sistotremastrum niveocremeum HHB9708 TaxID=1314777 RepID=A0A164ZZ56_9AGAM|nr:PIN domain-like protein [Sistotremastrum niveocremeum HHB9708]